MVLTKEDVIGYIKGVRYRCSDGSGGCINMPSEHWRFVLHALKGAIVGMRKRGCPKENINETVCEINAIEEALAEVGG